MLVGSQCTMRRAIVAGVVACAALMPYPQGAAQFSAAQAFLQDHFRYSTSDLRDLSQGRAAVRALDTTDPREIAIAGAIRVGVSPQFYVDQLRNIVDFKRHDAVRQIGTFSSPPTRSDVAALSLDREHLDGLRNCRLQGCGLQLSREAIDLFNREVDWSSPDAPAAATRVMHETLTQIVARYERRGDAGLVTYEDQRTPISVADEFRAMMAAPPRVLAQVPKLEQHLTRYPAGRGTAVTDVLYWSKEDVGPKVIISVTHMAIARIDGDGPVQFAAASKQLYGSSYFDSSLGLTLLLQDDTPGSVVLVYVNRSRVDALDGFLSGLKRAVVRARGRSAMADTLVRIRTRLPARLETQ